MSQRMPDYEALRAAQARSQQADRIHNERDLSFAAHCEGYGLEWLDEPDERKTP